MTQMALAWVLSTDVAWPGTIAVTAEVDGGPLPDAAIQSAVWHELRTAKGHDPLLLGSHEDPVQRMSEARVSTLLTVQVTWHPEALWVDGGLLGDEVPSVEVVEWRLLQGRLEQQAVWQGAASLAVTPDDAPNTWRILPEVALQRAIARSLREVGPPVWSQLAEEPIRLPIQVCVDSSWRDAHGAAWERAAARRVGRADDLLRQAGLGVRIEEWCEWTPPPGAQSLAELLEDLAEEPLEEGLLRVGLTAHPGLQTRDGWVDDVGRAFTPGRDVVVVDQRAAVEHDPDWDVADEGVAIAHELLHALGLPHNQNRQFVMSEVQRGNVHVLAPSTQALARAAVLARYRHWDPIAATQALSDAADAHIADPALALDYIRENLLWGPGIPPLEEVSKQRMTALGHRAIERHWASQRALIPSRQEPPADEVCGE